MHPYGSRVTLACAHCGATFERLRSQQKGRVPYCSAVCRALGVGQRRTRTLAARFGDKVNQHSGHFWNGSECWEWTGGGNQYGYGMIIEGGHAGKRLSAHRVAYELAHGPVPAGLYVCHSCDNPPCCRPDHLFLGTQKDNVQDCITKGRHSPPPHRRG